jgi:hypothetical protein
VLCRRTFCRTRTSAIRGIHGLVCLTPSPRRSSAIIEATRLLPSAFCPSSHPHCPPVRPSSSSPLPPGLPGWTKRTLARPPYITERPNPANPAVSLRTASASQCPATREAYQLPILLFAAARKEGCAGSSPTSTTTSRGSAATSSRSSSTASAASSTAATTPPGSRSMPTARSPPPLPLPLPTRGRTPGRRRSCSARRARSRTSCDPSTPVSPLPFQISSFLPQNLDMPFVLFCFGGRLVSIGRVSGSQFVGDYSVTC